MSLLSALKEQENKPDHGWTHSNMFSQDTPSSQSEQEVNVWPESETNITEVSVRTSETVPVVQTSEQISSPTGNSQGEVSLQNNAATLISAPSTPGTAIQQLSSPIVVACGDQTIVILNNNLLNNQTPVSIPQSHPAVKEGQNTSQNKGQIYKLLTKSQKQTKQQPPTPQRKYPIILGPRHTTPVSNHTIQTLVTTSPATVTPDANTQLKTVLVSGLGNVLNTTTVSTTPVTASVPRANSVPAFRDYYSNSAASKRVGRPPIKRGRGGRGGGRGRGRGIKTVASNHTQSPDDSGPNQVRLVQPNLCTGSIGLLQNTASIGQGPRIIAHALKRSNIQPNTSTSQSAEKQVFAKYCSSQQSPNKTQVAVVSLSSPSETSVPKCDEASPQMIDHGYASVNSNSVKKNLELQSLSEIGSNLNACDTNLRSGQEDNSISVRVQETSSVQTTQTSVISSPVPSNNIKLYDALTKQSPTKVVTTTVPADSVSNSTPTAESTLPSSISGDNVYVTGNLNLQKNTVYLVRSADNAFTTMMYDGECLKPCQTPQASDGDSPVVGMSGGGLGDKKERALRGNATGLNMSGNRGLANTKITVANTKDSAIMISPPENKVFRNGRFWKHSDGPQNLLTRKPLHEQQGPNTKSSGTEITEADSVELESSGSSVQAGTSRSSQDSFSSDSASNIPEGRKRTYEVVDEETVVHCKFCGYSSSDIQQCERCGRKFPTNVKVILVKRAKTVQVKHSDSGGESAISKQSFYGKNQAVALPGDAIVNYIKHRGARRVNVGGRSPRSTSLSSVKVVRKAIPEPVTIHISSDEDEPEQTSDPAPAPASSGSSAAPDSSTATAAKVNNSDDPDDLSQLVNVLPVKRPSSPTFSTSRITRMENQSGELVTGKTTEKRKSPTLPSTEDWNGTNSNLNARPPSQSDAEESLSDSSITMNARRVSIGTLSGVPVEPIVISKEGIYFYIEGEENSYRINLQPRDLQQCLFCLSGIPVIFLHVTNACGTRIREQIKKENAGEIFFNPESQDIKHQFITIILTTTVGVTETRLSNLLGTYMAPRNHKKDFIYQMNAEEAQHHMTEVCPDGLAEVEQYQKGQETKLMNQTGELALAGQGQGLAEGERSPSPPRILFSGPVIKLITFPPPPEKGGIQVTNEDLFCLQEGEFLNDVIIDFYLKYILYRKLSEADRKRTHVFSSFFFKRLTQRTNRGPVGAGDTPDMTPAEKKHARVKTWTKNVDLFEKDFVIVPINEHSHWFLAIICYPGLNNIQSVKFIPKANTVTMTKILLNPAARTSEVFKNPKTEGEKSMKLYKIPKVGQKDRTQTDEEKKQLDDSEEKTEDSSEPSGSDSQSGTNGNSTQESMDTSENPSDETLSAEQASELEEQMETPMETEGTEKPQQILTATKYFGRECRGRELTKEEEKDPAILRQSLLGQRQPCILVLDSLAGQSRNRIIAILKDYLQVEWDVKKKTKNSVKDRIRGSIPKVPQQTNFSDCGVYVLQYVDSFFSDPVQDFSIPLKSLANWFTEEQVTSKREEIREIVMQLKEEQEQNLKS